MVKRIVGTVVVLILVGMGAFWMGKSTARDSGNDTPVALNSDDKPMECPVRIQAGEYRKDMSFGNQVAVVDEPMFIENPQVIRSDKSFIEKDFIAGLYKLDSNDEWYETRKLDVDGDGANETIISANTAMTKTPHIAMVVKDGKIIFEAKGAQIWIEPYYTGKGFILEETLDWLKGEAKNTLFLPKDGGFLPVWTQKKCWIGFE